MTIFVSSLLPPWRREVERGGVDASPRARLPPHICRCCCRRRLITASSASDALAVSAALPGAPGLAAGIAGLVPPWIAAGWHRFTGSLCIAFAARAPSSWPPPPSARCTPVGSAGRRMPGCLRTLWGARYLLVLRGRRDSGSRGSSNQQPNPSSDTALARRTRMHDETTMLPRPVSHMRDVSLAFARWSVRCSCRNTASGCPLVAKPGGRSAQI